MSDADFKEVLTAFTNSQKQSIVSFDSLAEWWDNLKVGIRNKCVEFCKNKRRGTNSEGNTVTKRLIRLKNLFHLGDVSVASEITDTENALSSFILQEAEGAKIRSRAKWIEKAKSQLVLSFA